MALAASGCARESSAPGILDPEKPAGGEAAAEAPEQADDASNEAAGEASPSPRSLREPSVCGPEMALVEGRYCLAPEHRCLGYQDIPSATGVVPNHCVRYAQPVACFQNRRRPMRFCMDRYEWPNRAGEKPDVLVSWLAARDRCASVGKRLCTEEEFNFACEGEEMRPYVYGFERDPGRCNFDLPYRARTVAFTAFDACLGEAKCRAAFEAIDQRAPAGSFGGCRSPAGIYDLNGNVNEWVMLPENKGPRRSGLKGGWWGPVRNRCRPTVTFHDEADFGYEVGFRCCADAATSP
jgi:formylglycine-generating enzyme